MGHSGRKAGGRAGQIVGAVVVLALLPAFGWPWISAWWLYPAPPPEVFRTAFAAEAAAQRFVTAFDARGAAVTLAAADAGAAVPGACERSYQPDDRQRSGARGTLPFAGGMAEFTCVATLTAPAHGSLRAVVGLRLYTRPGPDPEPRANILPDGPYARDMLARLSAGR